MKKTISTSIGGIVFNVEEDAHAKLSAYLDDISASLKNSEGHDEIMSDIEARIAEIFQQKISNFKQVITIDEVTEVIGIMGNPEDFGAPASHAGQTSSSTPGAQYNAPMGGRRRIFRDTDDKVFFGVCSGLSHHFGVDPIWLRLAFGLSILIGGFGLLLYILLAIITPKARTSAERLEMMGEAADVNNIRKIIEEEMENVKKKVKDFGNEIRYPGNNDKGKEFGKNMGDFVSSVGHGIGNLMGGIFKGILIFIAVIIAVICVALLAGLIVSLTSGVNVIHIESGSGHVLHYSVHNFLDMLSVTGTMRTVLITGIFLFFGIPLLAIIVRFARAAAGRKRPFQWFTISAAILWTVAWILMFVGIATAFSHFSVKDFTKNDVIINPSTAKSLYIKMDNRQLGEAVIELDSLNMYISDQNEFRGNPSFCVEQSPDSNYHLILTKIARGITKKEADDYADAIDYSFSNRDSTLVLDPYYNIDPSKGWRKQKLELTMEVPLNKSIFLPEGIDHILCHAMHHKGQRLGGQKWIMSGTGLIAGQN